MGVRSRWCRFSLLDEEGSEIASGFLTGDAGPDIDAVNAIARLVLTARRSGTTFKLFDACPELIELIELAGLSVQVDR